MAFRVLARLQSSRYLAAAAGAGSFAALGLAAANLWATPAQVSHLHLASE
jgi:hypothetical protein